MIRSLSTSALGQPSETMPTLGWVRVVAMGRAYTIDAPGRPACLPKPPRRPPARYFLKVQRRLLRQSLTILDGAEDLSFTCDRGID
jgi:hypothetical protein